MLRSSLFHSDIGSVLNYKTVSDRHLILWSKIKNELVGLTSCSNAGCQMGVNCAYSLIFSSG